jgi:hypothetical protein
MEFHPFSGPPWPHGAKDIGNSCESVNTACAGNWASSIREENLFGLGYLKGHYAQGPSTNDQRMTKSQG